MRSKMIIGSRGSKLALAQADIAISRLQHACPYLDFEIRKITTSGDRDQKRSLTEIGGKGIFIKELEQALLDKTIDIAVHSFKDITSSVPEELELCSFFSPESVCDVLISKGHIPLECLPPSARIATSSMRRKALLSRIRPDLEFIDIRGNIDTRLNRLEQGLYDGIILSEAGLIRLGLQSKITQRFDPATFFPAPGQGVIALEIRSADSDIRSLCMSAGNSSQYAISIAELSVLINLGFDCRTAFGVHTTLTNDSLHMNGFYVHHISGDFIQKQVTGPVSEPHQLGSVLCQKLLNGKE